MKRLHWLIGFMGLCVTSVFAATPDHLALFDNQYSAKMYGFSIEVNSRLTTRPDGNYDLLFSADAMLGAITETSQLKWDGKEHTVIPLQYNYKRNGLGKDREVALKFDWNARQVNNLQNNTAQPIASAQKLQDGLSYQLQLRQDLLAGKNNLVYPIADGKKIKEYRFEIVGEEVLKTPLGDVKTVKVKRSHATEERNTYAWFAKDFQYLLVRLQQEENGSAYTIYISKASLNGKAIEHF